MPSTLAEYRRTICLDFGYIFDIIILRVLPEKTKDGENMSKPIILKALPIVLLALLCLVLGGIIIAQNAGGGYVPTMADVEEPPSDTTAPTEDETAPPETEPPETDPEPETVEPVVVASEGLEFTSLGDGTSYVSGAGSCRDSFIILPEYSPFGEKVVGIGSYAFRGCDFLKCIELNENLRFIGAYAFYGTDIVNAQIPAELEPIGDFAFAACTELEAITVDSANSIYADIEGVLYTKDYSKLICYPAGKSDNSLFLSSTVDEVATMAFYNCSSIKIVNFDGSHSAFRRIKIGAGNECFENAVVTFTEGGSISSK